MQNKGALNFKPQTKKLTYRTADRFRRNFFGRNPSLAGRIRSLGGHR